MWLNEIDGYCARWLRNLYPDAMVDERSICDLRPDDIPPGPAHFFAGIGGWPYALDLAGWLANEEVWTGSCPCQPFSAAGRNYGVLDSRHLWPAFRRLIAERRPATIFGEQVASKAGRQWLAGVRLDLERLGYAVGVADLCAASVGAPHIRQRLFWVADAQHSERGAINPHRQDGRDGPDDRWPEARGIAGARGQVCGLAESDESGPQGRHVGGDGAGQCAARAGGMASGLGDAERERDADARRGHSAKAAGRVQGADGQREWIRPDARQSDDGSRPWADAIWLPCLDGKARRVGAGLCPLAHGVPNRASQLRAYGNAIVPQVAAEFVRAHMDTWPREAATR